VRRAYREELRRIDLLEYEGKPARPNRRIILAYYDALGPFFE
jgi:hypothetical protein